MRGVNKAIQGGHCYGFAVLAETIHRGWLPRFGYQSISQLGARKDTTYSIPLLGNRKVQRSLARAWYYQTLPSVTNRAIKGRPSEVLNRLRQDLRPGAKQVWTLVVFEEGSGGHAVTPYAMIGEGHVEINERDPDAQERSSARRSAISSG